MDFGTNPYDIAFLSVGPAAALLSLRFQNRWLILLASAALIGWAFEFRSDHWVDVQWASVMEHTPNPSSELINRADADGASKAATLLIGLPLAAIYAAAWIGAAYGIRQLVKRPTVVAKRM
jgi:hypothetical protein